MTPLARRLVTPIIGRRRLQGVFERLHELSLAGMNLGEGANPRTSGESHVLAWLASDLFASRHRAVVLDVGANVGNYTDAVLAAMGGRAEVWALEPSASAFAVLESRGQAHVRNIGLSDRERQAVLHSPARASNVASLHDQTARLNRLQTVVDAPETVQLTTLDRFCAREGIGHIDLLKLDVEGHETRVLDGASRMIEAGAIDVIQFEVGAANLVSRTFLRDFFDRLEHRYVIHRVLSDGLRALPRYRESHEAFKRATNYLAVARRLGHG